MVFGLIAFLKRISQSSKKLPLGLGVFLLGLTLPPTQAATPFQLPDFQTPIVDQVGLFSAEAQNRLDSIIRQIQASGKAQVGIFVPTDLQGADIESFSIAAAEKWKLGHSKADEGILIVIAPKERAMRIEVGYGLEGDLPDAFCKKVISEIMVPLFQKGRYADGVEASLFAISDQIKVSISGADQAKNRLRSGKTSVPPWLPKLIFLAVILIFLFGRFFGIFHSVSGGPLGRTRGWGGGSGGFGGGGFGGGGWGGGGGGFGGGGASGRW